MSLLPRRRRVPVVLQLERTECGAACLAMILAHHGKPTPLAVVREACGAGRDGTTALAIAQAARGFGLRVRSYSAELDAFPTVELPAVVFWRFEHFLVVERYGADGVDVVDPAVGRRRLTPKEFDEGFTGVVLCFEPGERFRPERAGKRFTWRSYAARLLRTPKVRGALLQVVLASFVVQALGLALPVFTKVVVDEVLPHRLESVLLPLGLGMGVWILAQTLTAWLRSALLVHVQARLDAEVMLSFFEHLLSLPFRYFQQRTSGDLVMRLSSNQVLREILTSQTISALFDGILVVSYLVLLFALAPSFALAVLVVGALQVLLLAGTTPKVFAFMQSDLQAQADSQGYLVEALHGIETLKSSGVEDRALERWSSLFFAHLNVSVRRGRFGALVEAGMALLQGAAPVLLLLLGASLVLEGDMTLGTMLALNALAASFLAPLSSLVASGQGLQMAGAHLDRIADVLEAAPEQSGPGVVPDRVEGRIELRDVTFRYQPGAAPVIRGVSLTVAPGEKVAIVGPTGSGKSTLAKLMLGLYRPSEGGVLFDGRPIEEYDLPALRRRFGVVLQESFLFRGSIRDNVALHDPSMPLDQVREAAAFAALDEEIDAMPMAYDTDLAEGGGGLSGGQRQRLSIARAIASRPAVLLLDEATSHLDALTEAKVDQNLAWLSCTRVVIAHRLSTIRNADRILVLKDGALAEEGTHGDLVARGGFYARLVGEQVEA